MPPQETFPVTFSQALACAALIGVLAACSPSPMPTALPPEVAAARAVAADPSATPDQIALAMVQGNRIGANLEGMANRGARVTTAYGALVQALGPSRADAEVTKQIKVQLPRYQSLWDANLATAYASQMTPEQMRSIALEGKRSPHFEDFVASRDAVSTTMREQSTPILQELLVKALEAALLEAREPTP